MSLDATNWAWRMQSLTALEKLVLLSLADRAGESHESWPSWSRLALDTCSDRKTVGKCLASLVKKNIIKKTGELKKRVPVYILIGVTSREEEKLSTEKKSSSTKNGTVSKTNSTKNGTRSSTKNGTQNLSVNLQENLSGEIPFFSIKTETQNRMTKKEVPFTDDIICQIEYYVMKSSDKRDASESIDIAIALHTKKQWRIPSGYNGITSKSIADKELRDEREKREGYAEEANVMRGIRTKVVNDSMLQLKSILNVTKPQD